MGHHGCDPELDENERQRRAERRAEKEARLRELEWAATYVKTTPARRCRCAGSCPWCRERTQALSKIGPDAILELIRMVRR